MRRAPPSSRRRRPPSAATSTTCATTRPASRPASRGAIRLRFFSSPVAIHGDGRVEAIELVRNELVDGRAVATDERETIDCGIVFRSVGYQGVPLPGVPFDERIRDDPERGRPRRARALRRRLDQARPERRDRDEQEGRDRDGGAAARGRPGGAAAPKRRRARSRRCSRSGASTPSSTPAGRRSTRPSAPPVSRTAGRGSSSAAGTRCSPPPSNSLCSASEKHPSFWGRTDADRARQFESWSGHTIECLRCGQHRDVQPRAAAARRSGRLPALPVRRLGLLDRPDRADAQGSFAISRSSAACASARCSESRSERGFSALAALNPSAAPLIVPLAGVNRGEGEGNVRDCGTLRATGFLERASRFAANGTTLGRDTMAGVTTFIVMSYIIFVNPQILSFAGIEGLSEIGLPFNQVLAATCLVAGVMTILMGLYTNRAYAIAPGLGLNAVVAFGLVAGEGLVVPGGDGPVVVEGIAVTILVLTGDAREDHGRDPARPEEGDRDRDRPLHRVHRPRSTRAWSSAGRARPSTSPGSPPGRSP